MPFHREMPYDDDPEALAAAELERILRQRGTNMQRDATQAPAPAMPPPPPPTMEAPPVQRRGIAPPPMDMEALISGEPTSRAIVDALRGREALGELGMAGGEWSRRAAAPVLSGARGRLGEETARRDMLLKRSLWQQQGRSELPLDPALLDLAPSLGFTAEELRALPPRQASNMISQRLVQRAVEADKAKRLATPEAQAAASAKEEADRLDRELKRASIESTKATVGAKKADTMSPFEAAMRRMPAAAQVEYTNLAVDADNLDKIIASVEKSPEAFGVGKSVPVLSYFQTQTRDPAEIAKRSKVFSDAAEIAKRIFGATITSGDQARANEFLPQPNDTADVIVSKLRGAVSYARDKRAAVERELERIAGVKAPPVPAPAGVKRPRRTIGNETREWNGTAWVPVGSP